MSVSKKPPSKSESHVERSVRFIGEQDGLPEREFKQRIVPLLDAYGVKRCYLARVVYEPSSSPAVALCILPQRALLRGQALLQEIGAVFGSMFAEQQHLDMFFIDDDQDARLIFVCRPFFDSESKR